VLPFRNRDVEADLDRLARRGVRLRERRRHLDRRIGRARRGRGEEEAEQGRDEERHGDP